MICGNMSLSKYLTSFLENKVYFNSLQLLSRESSQIKIKERRSFYNERIRRLEVAKASNPSSRDLVKRIQIKTLFYKKGFLEYD